MRTDEGMRRDRKVETARPQAEPRRASSSREALETLLQSLWQDLNRLETFAHIATAGFEVVLPRDPAKPEDHRTAERLYVLLRAIAETSADALERVGQGLTLLSAAGKRQGSTSRAP